MREQDRTIQDLDEALQAIKELLVKSSASGNMFDYGQRPGPYERSLAELKGILDKSPDKDAGLWYVLFNDVEDNQHTVAITGNGPTSEANAKLLAAAPQIIRYLITQLKELQDDFAFLEHNKIHMQNYDTSGVAMWWNGEPDKPRTVHGENIRDAIRLARERDRAD